ncbi:PP2C family protein-serine/threonine phosphatase [Amycolatopsis samaneae]|uniref:PP2C family protein-serine/threonine phosphatase n=1 Tax=Amycolatopsis samaneae TaxID=664691 RepID=A0ABW5GSG4_9PSEU
MDAGVAVPSPRCPGCAHPAVPSSRYCERCGRRLDGRPKPASRWLASTPGDGRCALDLAAVAGVTDRGYYRRRNEDVLAIGRVDGVSAAVVCDGVSTSERPEEAATAAASAGITTLLRLLGDGAPPATATRDAALAAGAAAAGAGSRTEENPPCCTYVSAIATTGSVVVGWIGDSPAYWAETGGARRLTVDDADPRTRALNQWLGADARRVAPHVKTFVPANPGQVLVCSDGLSRYLDRDGHGSGGAPAEAARGLLEYALDAGGHDNITVAVLAFPPPRGSDALGGVTP